MTKRAPKKIFTYINILNILAIIAVLFLHHNFGADHYVWGKKWIVDVLTPVLFRYAVPVFVMITGATLLAYREKYDTKTFFKKRFLKLLIPAIAWIAFMFFWNTVIIKDPRFTNFSYNKVMHILANNLEDAHYWYIFNILGIYLTIPILSLIAKKENKKALQYAISSLFVFNALLPLASSLTSTPVNPFLKINISGYMIYVLIGYCLHTFDIKKGRRYALYATAIVFAIATYIVTIFASKSSGKYFSLLSGENLYPYAIIYSSAIFLFVKNAAQKMHNAKAERILKTLASCSFGVYLSHFLIMYYEKAFLIHLGLETKSWVWRFACPFLTYALCVGLVLILKKIPFLRHIVP